MIIGDDLIGFVSHKFKSNIIDAYIVKLSMFPISICFEKHYDYDYIELKLILFNKYTIALYVSK